MSLFKAVPTTLDLNGPILSYSTQPVGVAVSTTGTATLTGIATITFTSVGSVTNPASGTGSF